MTPSEISRLIEEFGRAHVLSIYGYSDLMEGDYDICHMVLIRRFPASVQSVGDGTKPSGREVDKAHRAMETLEEVAAGPVNCARGIRTPEQQRKVYDKVFKHNHAAAVERKSITRTGGTRDAKDIGRFELAGQLPREAFLEEVRTSGRKAQDVLADTETMGKLAKDHGWSVED